MWSQTERTLTRGDFTRGKLMSWIFLQHYSKSGHYQGKKEQCRLAEMHIYNCTGKQKEDSVQNLHLLTLLKSVDALLSDLRVVSSTIVRINLFVVSKYYVRGLTVHLPAKIRNYTSTTHVQVRK